MKTKILILVILFALQSASHLFDVVTGLMEGESFGEYGNAFVYTGIMGFIAWALYFRRDKWSYFTAIFLTGLTLLRVVLGFGLIIYSGNTLPTELAVVGALAAVLFGLVPLLLLLNKELRGTYLSAPK